MVEQLAPQGRPQLSHALASNAATCPCQRLLDLTRHAPNLSTWPVPGHMSLSHNMTMNCMHRCRSNRMVERTRFHFTIGVCVHTMTRVSGLLVA
jgi:hypothetical protein